MSEIKPVAAPMDVNSSFCSKNEVEKPEMEGVPYQELIGFLFF